MQVKNIVVGQKYTKNGEAKTKWTTIGVMFIKDDGKMSGRIDMQPLNWDGNFVLFDIEDKQPRQQQQSQYGTPRRQAPVAPIAHASNGAPITLDPALDSLPF